MDERQNMDGSHTDGAANNGDRARDLDTLLSDIAALESVATDWPDRHRNAADARVRAVEDLNAEAFRRLIKAVQGAAGVALREAVQDPLVYAVLRRHGILKASLEEQVEAALESIRPQLASHGGDVELVSVTSDTVEVRFLGACDGCPASGLTFYAGVKKAVQDHVPQILHVKQAKGLGGGESETVHFQSPFAAGEEKPWKLAMMLDDLADNSTAIVTLDDHSLLISRFGDRVTCFENACAHMGLPMDGGEISNGLISCPYHGFQYALESGECLTAPEVQLRPHAVRVKGSRVEVQLSEHG